LNDYISGSDILKYLHSIEGRLIGSQLIDQSPLAVPGGTAVAAITEIEDVGIIKDTFGVITEKNYNQGDIPGLLVCILGKHFIVAFEPDFVNMIVNNNEVSLVNKQYALYFTIKLRVV